jgi:hypothetical protein
VGRGVGGGGEYLDTEKRLDIHGEAGSVLNLREWILVLVECDFD